MKLRKAWLRGISLLVLTTFISTQFSSLGLEPRSYFAQTRPVQFLAPSGNIDASLQLLDNGRVTVDALIRLAAAAKPAEEMPDSRVEANRSLVLRSFTLPLAILLASPQSGAMVALMITFLVTVAGVTITLLKRNSEEEEDATRIKSYQPKEKLSALQRLRAWLKQLLSSSAEKQPERSAVPWSIEKKLKASQVREELGISENEPKAEESAKPEAKPEVKKSRPRTAAEMGISEEELRDRKVKFSLLWQVWHENKDLSPDEFGAMTIWPAESLEEVIDIIMEYLINPNPGEGDVEELLTSLLRTGSEEVWRVKAGLLKQFLIEKEPVQKRRLWVMLRKFQEYELSAEEKQEILRGSEFAYLARVKDEFLESFLSHSLEAQVEKEAAEVFSKVQEPEPLGHSLTGMSVVPQSEAPQKEAAARGPENSIASFAGETQAKQSQPNLLPEGFELKGSERTFVVGKFLRQGGEGKVYEAADKATGKKVAIKVVEKQGEKRLKREVDVLLSVSGEQVVAVLDSGKLDDLNWFAMPLAEESLEDRLKRKGISHVEACALALQIAQALGRLHEKGVIHRDVKPANILIGENGRIQLADLGLAKVDTGGTFTQTGGGVVGTIQYMAPEQLSKKLGEVTSKADIFALGLVLAEMVLEECPATEKENQTDAYTEKTKELQKKVEKKIRDLRKKKKKEDEKDQQAREEKAKLLEVALKALKVQPAARPDVKTLVGELKPLLAVQENRSVPRQSLAEHMRLEAEKAAPADESKPKAQRLEGFEGTKVAAFPLLLYLALEPNTITVPHFVFLFAVVGIALLGIRLRLRSEGGKRKDNPAWRELQKLGMQDENGNDVALKYFKGMEVPVDALIKLLYQAEDETDLKQIAQVLIWLHNLGIPMSVWGDKAQALAAALEKALRRIPPVVGWNTRKNLMWIAVKIGKRASPLNYYFMLWKGEAQQGSSLKNFVSDAINAVNGEAAPRAPAEPVKPAAPVPAAPPDDLTIIAFYPAEPPPAEPTGIIAETNKSEWEGVKETIESIKKSIGKNVCVDGDPSLKLALELLEKSNPDKDFVEIKFISTRRPGFMEKLKHAYFKILLYYKNDPEKVLKIKQYLGRLADVDLAREQYEEIMRLAGMEPGSANRIIDNETSDRGLKFTQFFLEELERTLRREAGEEGTLEGAIGKGRPLEPYLKLESYKEETEEVEKEIDKAVRWMRTKSARPAIQRALATYDSPARRTHYFNALIQDGENYRLGYQSRFIGEIEIGLAVDFIQYLMRVKTIRVDSISPCVRINQALRATLIREYIFHELYGDEGLRQEKHKHLYENIQHGKPENGGLSDLFGKFNLLKYALRQFIDETVENRKLKEEKKTPAAISAVPISSTSGVDSSL